MRYFNEHRRKLIKQNYIRGTKATAQGVQKLELENTVNLPPCKLEIHGNTEQKMYDGSNVFNLQNALNTDNWIYVGGSWSLSLNLEVGKEYTISVDKIKSVVGVLSLCRKDDMSKWAYETVIRFEPENVGNKFIFFKADGRECLWIYRNSPVANAALITELFTSGVRVMLLDGIYTSDTLPPYEPYVGGATSPNSDYPQHIDSVDNLELTVEGANLFNEALLLTNPAITNIDNGYLFSEYQILWSLYANSEDLYINHIKSVLKPNTDYTIAYEVVSAYNTSSGSIRFNDVDNNTIVVVNGGKGKKAVTFNLTQEQIDSIYRIYMWGTPPTQVEISPTVMRNFQLLEGTYTVDTLPSYEPYNENPVTISAGGIELLGIDEYCDRLEIDFANKKAFKNERVLYKSVGELIDAYGAEYDGIGAICINNDQPRMEIYERNIPYYCTHFISYHNDPHVDESNPRFEVTVSGQIWFYYPPLRSVEEFKAWCYENDVKIAYVLENEHQIDITNTEAVQALLNLTLPEGESVIFEVSADLAPSNVSLEYYSKTKEDSYFLTAHYKDREGNVLLESKTSSVRSGSRYKVIAPEIEGYMPICAEYEGYMNKDMEIVITYSSI